MVVDKSGDSNAYTVKQGVAVPVPLDICSPRMTAIDSVERGQLT